MWNKKGVFGSLVVSAKDLILFSVVVVMGIILILNFGNNSGSTTANTSAVAMAGYLGTSSGGLGSWTPILVIILIAAIMFSIFGLKLNND